MQSTWKVYTFVSHDGAVKRQSWSGHLSPINQSMLIEGVRIVMMMMFFSSFPSLIYRRCPLHIKLRLSSMFAVSLLLCMHLQSKLRPALQRRGSSSASSHNDLRVIMPKRKRALSRMALCAMRVTFEHDADVRKRRQSSKRQHHVQESASNQSVPKVGDFCSSK